MTLAFRVNSHESGLALVKILASRLSEYSSKTIKRAIDAHGCFVNGKVERFASKKLVERDSIEFYLDRLLVKRNKSGSGFKVIKQEPHFTLWEKSSHAVCDERFTLHRLDKETTGLLLTSDEESFHNLFRSRQIEKTYLALVDGIFDKERGKACGNIGLVKRKGKQKFMGLSEEGKEAITKWRVLAETGGVSLIECKLITGRTHQIRIHMGELLQKPILGDYQYYDRFSTRALRMMLHAWKLSFIDPITGEKRSFVSDLPTDFKEIMKQVGISPKSGVL